MTVKILLKRQVSEDKISELKELIDQLRTATTGQPGYISGDTLRRVDKPGEHLVISKWKSLAYWDRWFEQPKRVGIQQKIDDLLGSTTVYEVYEYDNNSNLLRLNSSGEVTVHEYDEMDRLISYRLDDEFEPYLTYVYDGYPEGTGNNHSKG